MAKKKICSVNRCGKVAKSRGLCCAHYHKAKRYGYPPLAPDQHGLKKKWIVDRVGYRGKGCLIWPFSRLRKTGYPMVRCDGSCQVASRVMCREAHGPPPEESYEAAHTCGNGRGGCVNPMHIRWATRLENHRDKIKHGTTMRGEKAHFAKLTKRQVRSIRSMDGKVSQTALSKKYGVATATISRIVNRTCWGWLDQIPSEKNQECP